MKTSILLSHAKSIIYLLLFLFLNSLRFFLSPTGRQFMPDPPEHFCIFRLRLITEDVRSNF